MIKVSVIKNSSTSENYTWWLNFIDYHSKENDTAPMMDKKSLNDRLLEWGLTDVPGSQYIESPDEEHFILFVLRWS